MIASLILTVLFAESQSMPAQLEEALHHIVAGDAQQCGIVTLDQDGAAAITCAQSALSTGKPFWIAVQYQGTDSEIWSGAGRGKDGSIWIVRYDSDATGGSRDHPTPTLQSFVCKDVEITIHRHAVIWCPSQAWR
jgi:hypothetical protein